MRQIKFRAWDGKEMIVPSAVINGKAAILKRCNDDRVMEDDEGVHYYCNWDMDVVTDYPLMQYIGLQDKNGGDFCVGDIGEFSNGDRFIIAMEEWLEVSIQWIGEPECEDQARDLPRISKATIIGNIHLNPELIK